MKKNIFLFLTFLGFATILIAQNWTIYDVDRGVKPALEVDNHGTVHIAYMLEALPGFVKNATWNGEGFDLKLISEAYFYGPLDIALDANNLPHIAIHDHNLEDQVHYFQEANGNWTNDIIKSSGHDGWDNRLLIDENEHIHVSSVDPSSGIEYSYFDGNAWTTESTGSPVVNYAGATSLAIDSNNNPYITYYNDGQKHLALLSKKNGNWVNEVLDSEGDVGQFSSLIMDKNDNIYISYYQDIGNGKGLIKFAQRIDNNWSISVVDTLNDVRISFSGARNMTSLRMDVSNRLHLAYSDQKIIKYAFFDGVGWNKEIVLDLTGQSILLGQQTSLGVANDNSLHITYYEVTNLGPLDGQVKYATKRLGTSTNELAINIKIFDVYPNPVQNQVIINYSIEKSKGKLSLLDIQGKELRQIDLNKKGVLYLDFSELNTGIYFLNITIDGQKVSRKVVKQ